MHGRRRTLAPVGLLMTATVLVACGVPLEPATSDVPASAPPSSAVDTLEPTDTASGALVVQLGLIADRTAAVRALIDEAAAVLEAAAGPGVDASARAAAVGLANRSGRDAVALMLGEALVSDPAADATGTDDPERGRLPGLLPAIAPDRAGDGSDDLVTGLVTLAGDAGGDSSRLVLELVRDPLVGDLGAWQRDPLGVIDLLRTAATRAVSAPRDTVALDAALLELSGELTRALGYALVLADGRDIELLSHAARAASGRLGVVIVAIDLAVERLEEGAR